MHISSSNPYDWLQKSLETIHRANWYRQVKTVNSLPGALIELEGRKLVNFASNDYLGLAGDERLVTAATEAIQKYGTGSTGSRLLSGHRELHHHLESAIANWKNTAAALVFSSGYLANLGTISALVGHKDLILSDQYNHSSLKNGAKLSNAEVISYSHCDMADLREKLHQNRNQYRRCLIITDTVFSMDGDICPLPQLLSVAQEFNCMTLVDEAHAMGVLGDSGAGCVEYFNCNNYPLIQVGTLSKALGSLGGYVAGSRELIDFLKNRAATWIYTTGLSPGDTAAAVKAVEIIRQEPARIKQLWQNINYLLRELPSGKILPSQSSIICLGLNSPQAALHQSEILQQAGIFAPAIRPPTVPTSRIRLSVMATHTREHLAQLVQAFSN